MAFWIFKCNPAQYRLSDRLVEEPNDATTWTVRQHRNKIGPGDIAFLWETGPKGGIRAVIEIDSAPAEMFELVHEQSYWSTPDTERRLRVLGTLIRRNIHLTRGGLREVPGLENLSVFHGFQQMTNFPVSAEEGAILLRMVGNESKPLT